MRILFVTPYVPSLIRVRPFNFIKQLAKRHEVTLVCLLHDEHDAAAVEQMREYCESVYAIPLSKARSLMSCCRRLLTPVPLQAAYTDLPSARDLVTQVATNGAFDVLHVEHIRGAHLAKGVSLTARVYDSVDCITRLLKQKLAHRIGAFERALSYEELLKMRSYEPRIAATFDSVVITSERDRRALGLLIRRFVRSGRIVATRTGRDAADRYGQGREVPPADDSDTDVGGLTGNGVSRVAVVRNGVDSEYFRPMAAQVDASSIVFSGRMSYFANASAALQFYREVFPRVRRSRPDAKFKIVGSDPPDAVRKLAGDPAVEVTGSVPDMRPHLASAGVAVCPLTIGVGIQNKALEAMAMGKPVVATPLACSGIPDAIDGRHLVRATEPARMAEAILGLMDDPEYASGLGERAWRFVEDRYSWEAAVRELEAVYARTVEMHKSRVGAAA